MLFAFDGVDGLGHPTWDVVRELSLKEVCRTGYAAFAAISDVHHFAQAHGGIWGNSWIAPIRFNPQLAA